MGNTKSVQSQRRSQNRRKKNQNQRKGRRRQAHSSSSESDDCDQSILEIDHTSDEVLSCTTQHRDCNLCKDLYGREFIPMKELTLEKIPEPLRDIRVLGYIQIQEKISVWLQVHSTAYGGAFDYASGWACVPQGNKEEYAECPLEKCPFNGGNPHKAYGGITVYTNKHVIKSAEHATKCEVRFFYDGICKRKEDDEVGDASMSDKLSNDKTVASNTGTVRCNDDNLLSHSTISNNFLESSTCYESAHPNFYKSVAQKDISNFDAFSESCVPASSSLPSVSSANGGRFLKDFTEAMGFHVRQDNVNKDLVAMDIIYHDPNLFEIISACHRDSHQAWISLPGDLKIAMKEHVIVISHPHGNTKYVSFGRLLDLETTSPQSNNVKETRYSAATCKGSSGAPVFSGKYHYRPFTHSEKHIWNGSIVNRSLSY